MAISRVVCLRDAGTPSTCSPLNVFDRICNDPRPPPCRRLGISLGLCQEQCRGTVTDSTGKVILLMPMLLTFNTDTVVNVCTGCCHRGGSSSTRPLDISDFGQLGPLRPRGKPSHAADDHAIMSCKSWAHSIMMFACFTTHTAEFSAILALLLTCGR